MPRSSAVVPGAIDAEPIAMNKDHVNMAKFMSREDEDYKTLSAHLRYMATIAPLKIAKRWQMYGTNEG